MKQLIELVIVSEVGLDKNTDQRLYENALKNGAAQLMKDVLGTPKTHTETIIDYGDPV